MDISDSLAPRSDQLNADDLIAEPRTVTITDVRKGTAEQPVEVVTAEYGTGRPYKPGKSMRRVLAAVWGTDAAAWVGKRLTLYCDPDITFGRDKVGGIRVSHMSGLDQAKTLPLTVTRGKRKPYTVQPLPDAPTPTPTADDVANCNNTDTLRAMWNAADNDVKALIRARVDELNAAPEETP